MATRTVTLSDRPPVKIDEDAWPVIASASDSKHDGQVECQANRKSKWHICVRQHDDGRAVVYATYSYTSNWRNSRDYSAKHGVLLPAGSDSESICASVKEIADRMAVCECDDGDADRWKTLADECIADMPAESL